VTAVLLVAFIFFRQSAVEIYEELDRSITGAALHIADEEVMADLAKRSVEVYESIDDPLTLYNTDRKTYLRYFSDIQNSEEY
jgi:predicted porin